MKKRYFIIATLGTLLIILLSLMFSLENNKNQFKVKKVTMTTENECSEEFIQVEDRFNLNYFNSIDLKISFPFDFSKWKDIDEKYLYENPEIKVTNANLISCISYVTYDKLDKIYYLVLELGIKKDEIGYNLFCVQRINIDSFDIKIDELKTKKMKG